MDYGPYHYLIDRGVVRVGNGVGDGIADEPAGMACLYASTNEFLLASSAPPALPLR